MFDRMSLCSFLVCANCILNFQSSAFAEDTRPLLKIGWIGPLSGNSAVLGIDSARAVQMVFETYNSKPESILRLKLVSEDDQYDTAKAVKAYQKLRNIDQVRAVITITYGALFALAPNAERDSVLLLDPLDCNEAVAALPHNALCLAAMTEQIGILNAKTALSRGQNRAAILYFQDDPFFGTVLKSTEQTLTASGATVVLKEGYGRTNTDFRTVLTKAKRAGADSIYFYGYDEMASAMKQARMINSSASFYGTATLLSPELLSAAGQAVEGATFTVFTPDNSTRYAAFIDQFKNRYGQLPVLDISTVPSFDLANIIAEFAYSYVGSLQSAEFAFALRDHLYSMQNYLGASGSISMSADGATRSLQLATYEISKGQKHLLAHRP